MLGSMDANRGDYQNGWDTDQFPTNLNELTESMLIILEAGGFQGGELILMQRLEETPLTLQIYSMHILVALIVLQGH